jgi:hypothetical protein
MNETMIEVQLSQCPLDLCRFKAERLLLSAL